MHTPSAVPYWLDTAPPAPDRTSSTLPRTTDFAIVGGGFTGLSAALHLARLGEQVILLEKQTLGGGASGRNGGMASPGLAIGVGAAITRYGFPTAQSLYREYDRAIDFVEQVVRREAIECDFARTGKLTLAAKPAHVDRLRQAHHILTRQLGCAATLVGKAQLDSEIGSQRYHGGLVDPSGAGLHPGKFLRGLADRATALGVHMHERAGVHRVHRVSGYEHELVTGRGTVRARRVLVATSGYTSAAFRPLQLRIAPVGSFVIVTEPLAPAVVDEIMPTRRMASDTKNLLYYFRITPDNRLLFGGRARFTGSGPGADPGSGRILHRAMLSVFPQLAGTAVDYCWGGQVDMSLDRLVHAGERAGLFYSLGYSGHGVQMATYMGRVMAEVMLGNPEANPWRDFPFRRIPGHIGPPWFLPLAGAYYRFRDLVG